MNVLDVDLANLSDSDISVLRARVDAEYLDRNLHRARTELKQAQRLARRAEAILAAYESRED